MPQLFKFKLSQKKLLKISFVSDEPSCIDSTREMKQRPALAKNSQQRWILGESLQVYTTNKK